MNESKHTPGPWEVGGELIFSPGKPRCPPTVEIARVIYRGGGVIENRFGPATMAESDANRALIAAAPDTLAELKSLRAVMADALDNMPYLFPVGGRSDLLTPEQQAWRTKLKAATKAADEQIAKAEGRS